MNEPTAGPDTAIVNSDETPARKGKQEDSSSEKIQETSGRLCNNKASESLKIAGHDEEESSAAETSLDDENGCVAKWWVSVRLCLVSQFAWVPQNFERRKIKNTIRCALVAWVSVVLFVIPKVERLMGQAPFLIIIAAFLSPPSDPFVAVAEREILILFLTTVSWSWCCLGLFLANLARHQHIPTVTLAEALDGKYIEAAPSVITGVFIFTGTAMLLWIRARQGIGPLFFPCIIACLGIDIILPASALFPYPYYLLGRGVLLPLSFHSAIALLSAIFIFPSTISTLFTYQLSASLAPVLSVLSNHRTLLATPLTSPDFAPLLATVRKDTKSCGVALVTLTAAARLLKSDLTYGRFSPADFVTFQGMCRRMAGRANGLEMYFALVDPARERFPGNATTKTSAGTAPGTPRANSRVSLIGEKDIEQSGVGGASHSTGSAYRQNPLTQRQINYPPSQVSSRAPSISAVSHSHNKHADAQEYSTTKSHLQFHNAVMRPSTPTVEHHHHHHGHSASNGHHGLLHSSLLSSARTRKKKSECAVGTFESQRYLNLEATRLRDPHEDECNEKIEVLLKESCEPLLEACTLGISTVKEWLSTVRRGRLPEIFCSIGLLPTSPSADRSKIPGACTILDLLQVGQKKRREERKTREEKLRRIREVRLEVGNALEKFRTVDRHGVLGPYLPAFEERQYATPNQDQTQPQQLYSTALSRPPTPVNINVEGIPISELEGQGVGRIPGEKERERDGFLGMDAGETTTTGEYVMPPHHCLFSSYVYQYNLMQIASIIIEMFDEIIRLEETREECRLWTPVRRLFRWGFWSFPGVVEHAADEDDNPDVIQGINRDETDTQANETDDTPQPTTDPYLPSRTTGPAFPVDPDADLGLPRRRDPDALPPRNLCEALAGLLHEFFLGLGSGNVLFAIKGGLLALALSLPSLIRSSATFAYENRFIWAIFFAQMTLMRFRGDTAFALIARVISTFFGAITGMVLWYMSCGSGQGNPYGLAAVCGVFFPFFMYARLYWPVPLLWNFVFFVTASLVVGYSYQDHLLKLPGNPGTGFSVAWRRFVLITCGVVAAGIASFFPPSTTIRRYQRRLLSTTSAELGTIYCEILSFANTKHVPEVQEIIASLLAVRNKLARGERMRVNVGYEFSLRGRWPADRYLKLVELQIGLSYSLSHLMSVLEHLEPPWSRAFLRRTRFIDPEFQGDVLAVISMISFSLRTGSPLPQITPCPLMDRFLSQHHGLNVIHQDAEEDYGLPRRLEVATLKDEQYLMFSVGIATAFGIVMRLDRLMVAVKEVVGEQYHIHGVGAGVRLPRRAVPGFVPSPVVGQV